jgi:hypothetical protein
MFVKGGRSGFSMGSVGDPVVTQGAREAAQGMTPPETLSVRIDVHDQRVA